MFATETFKLLNHNSPSKEACDQKSSGTCGKGKDNGTGMVCVLEGQLENTIELYQCGVDPSRIITVEYDATTYLYQLLIRRGTVLESSHVLYTGQYQKFKHGIEGVITKNLFADHGLVDAQHHIVSLYLDYCGDLPPKSKLLSVVRSLPSLQLIGLTRGHRNTKREFPSEDCWNEWSPSSYCFAKWKHPMVSCMMWKKS